MTTEELFDYFLPVDLEDIGFSLATGIEKWGDKMQIHLANMPIMEVDESIDMAIIGVTESRLCNDGVGSAHSPNNIRRYFYNLMPQKSDIRVIDLGNLILGDQPNDTYFALAQVSSFLMQKKIIPIVLGGSNDIAIGLYKGYCLNSQIINLLSLDAKFDLQDDQQQISDENFLQEIICSDPNYLFDYTLIGYQSYFVDNKALQLLDDLKFEHLRLGRLQDNLQKVEPLVRDADMVMVDMNCVRASDCPCSCSPHGLYGEQLCKIVNYAGMSDKTSSLFFCGNNVLRDIGDRGSQIIAHAIWYFIDGYLWRKKDYPYLHDGNYLEFKVLTTDLSNEISFYKSKKSDRWWVVVPCTNEMKKKYFRHYIVPCLYDDYLQAGKGELPDRYMIAYNKLNL